MCKPLSKVCTTCQTPKPATEGYFSKQRQGRHGLTAQCRSCHRERMKGVNKRYYAKNREKELVRNYRQLDLRSGRACDLTAEWFAENITSKNCTYCGSSSQIGADRIDNSRGHTMDNVVPACRVCNKVRNNLFTVSEMKIIGKAIAEVMQRR